MVGIIIPDAGLGVRRVLLPECSVVLTDSLTCSGVGTAYPSLIWLEGNYCRWHRMEALVLIHNFLWYCIDKKMAQFIVTYFRQAYSLNVCWHYYHFLYCCRPGTVVVKAITWLCWTLCVRVSKVSIECRLYRPGYTGMYVICMCNQVRWSCDQLLALKFSCNTPPHPALPVAMTQ